MKRQNEQPIVEVKDVHKSFGDHTVLDGINLTVARGETVAVLGRSGTGKSVFLKLIIGLEQSDSGSISVQGQEIKDLGPEQLNEVRKKIGFLFQKAALYDSLTVEENVAFPLERHSKISEAERKDKVRELLSSVGMDHETEKLPSEISGGMQKRVGLARALALEPDILLFDEPTAGLDPITSDEIGKLILKLQKERKVTSIVVTHDIHSAKEFCDRLALMVLVEGTFAELKKSRNPFVVHFLNGSS